MFEIVTLILVLYVTYSIMRRSNDRRREVERLQLKVAELSAVVAEMQQSSVTEVSERLIEMELRDIRTQLEEFNVSADTIAQDAFEQVHFVEETISKSIVVAPGLPTKAESTL